MQSFHFCKSSVKFVAQQFLVFSSILLWVYTKTVDLSSKYRLWEQCFRTFSSSLVFVSLLITNWLSPFWKCVVPTKHCSMMYSRFVLNFLNHFKCFCGIKIGFPAKMNRCTLFSCFFHYDLWYRQNRQVTSHKYVPHCEWFELKLGMCGEVGLLMNFLKFHGDRASSTMFSQRCHKTYWTDLLHPF